MRISCRFPPYKIIFLDPIYRRHMFMTLSVVFLSLAHHESFIRYKKNTCKYPGRVRYINVSSTNLHRTKNYLFLEPY